MLRHASGLAHQLLGLALGAVLLALAAAGGLVWRLSEGPLDVTWLARRLAPLAVPGLAVGRVTLGLDRAEGGSVLRLAVTDGALPPQSVRSLAVTLALHPLFLGRVEPEDAAMDGLRLRVAQPTGPSAGLDPRLRRALAGLRHLSITDVQVDIPEWGDIRDGAVQLQRDARGALAGNGTAIAAAGAVSAQLAAQGSCGESGASVQATLSPVSPASLAAAVPALHALSALDAPVAVRAEATFGPGLDLLHAAVHAEAGPGLVNLPAKGGGTNAAQFAALALDADGTPGAATLQALRVVVQPPSGAAPTTVVLSGAAERAEGRFKARMTATADRLALADLGSIWPERVGGGSRPWLAKNLTEGVAHDGRFTFTLEGAEDGTGLAVTESGGSVVGDDVTIWWLRPIPPVEHVHAVVAWPRPDILTITATAGRDAGLQLKSGAMRIDGMSVHDQTGLISLDFAGPLAGVFALMRSSPLRMARERAAAFKAPAGTLAAHVTVQLPLETKMTADQVAIHVSGQVADAHLGDVAGGQDLDNGQLAFDVTNAGMTLSGPGQFGRIPGSVAAQLDFRDGPGTEVTEHVAVRLGITPKEAKAAGLGAAGLTGGRVAAAMDYAERRDGAAELQLDADLKDAAFVTPLGWSKAAGAPGRIEGKALLDHGRVVGLEELRAEAPGLSVQARSTLVDGRLAVVHLLRGQIGRTDATGTIALPEKEGQPYRITLAGPRLDLEGRLASKDAPAAPDKEGRPPGPGTPYTVDLRFERVLFGRDRELGPATLAANGVSGRVSAARLATDGPERLRLTLADAGTSRRLSMTVADLGLLLRETDLATEMDGGALALEGAFNDRLPAAPFNGKVDVQGFKVRSAPVVGKVLQAVTLYGLVDALQGPGLVFDRMATSFSLQGPVLEVENARAFSSSLGLTANGSFDFGRKLVNLQGTVVPAYFFNSLPGRLPLLGKLFSPEQGGGVFAATYGLHGALTDPAVSVNPLSALAPGFMRRLFGLF